MISGEEFAMNIADPEGENLLNRTTTSAITEFEANLVELKSERTTTSTFTGIP